MKLLNILILCFFIVSLFTSIIAQECIVTFPPGEPTTIDSTYGDPEVLLQYQPTQVRTIYIAAWIINTPTTPNCSGLSQNNLSVSIQKLNSDFAGAMIQFVCDQIEYIENDEYCYLVGNEFNELGALHNVDNKLNIFFVPNGEARGWSHYHTNFCAVVNADATISGILAHEVGHCFDLFHTHGNGIEELVNQSNCTIAGDFLCDTPAEPYNGNNGILGFVDENCNYFGTFRDTNNQLYTPDTRNFMCYTAEFCRDHFSTKQIQKMHQTLETLLSELISVSVPLTNKINGIVIPNILNQPSTLTIVGGETVNSSESTDLLDGNSYDIKTDQERFPNYQSYGTVKHNNWNGEVAQSKLTENYTIDKTNSPYRDANFLSLNYSKIEDRLDGFLIDQKGDFEFQDPWFVKSDGSQPGNYWRPCLSFYEPTGKEGATEKGVFLNQGLPNWAPPYYKIKLPQPIQNIYLPQTNKTHRFYFQGWNYDPNKISLQYPTSIQTGVVFKEPDAVLTANLKGTQLSNSQSTYVNGSQRKIVRIPDTNLYPQLPATLHSVYESNGHVWYEMSTDNGQTWEIMNDGKPLDIYSSGVGKCPSIESWYNQVAIVWQGKNSDGRSVIYLVTFQPFSPSSTIYELTGLQTVAPDFNYSYEEIDANPVIAQDGQGEGIVIWRGTYNNGTLSLKYRAGSIFHGASWYALGSVPQSDIYSINSTICGYKDGNNLLGLFQMAFQKSDKIYYHKITRSGTQINFTDFTEVSLNNGFSKNYSPSITACVENNNANVKLSWIAFRKTYIQDNPQGGGQQSLGETKVFCRSKNAIGWSAFNSYGSSINSVNINHNNDNTFAIAWSEALTSNYVNKFVRSDYPTEIYLANTSGKNLQVVNYDNLNNMRLNSFTTSTTPYSFSLSNTFYVIPHDIQYYMDGNIVQDTTTFYFRLGDILVGGQQVKFENLPDGISIPDYETLNSYFVSRPFTLTDNIDFIYSVEYGVTDSLSAAMALQDEKFAHFKVELIDDQSNELLGTFDDVTYNSVNIMLYEKIAYQVNTQGIGNRVCRLRLVTEDDLGLHYSISNCYNDQTDLGKLNLVQRTIDGVGVVRTYELEQNFPNPFNPTTVIKYQIPRVGNVVLKVYDILGSELATLVDEQKNEGRYEVNFDASNIASGVYIYRLTVNDFVNVKKMILLK